MREMRKWARVPDLALLLMALFVAGYLLRELIMEEKIFMSYGYFLEPDGTFDATDWFRSGMYKRRRMYRKNVFFERRSMTRVSPPPFHVSQVEELRLHLLVEINGLLRSWPNLNPYQKDRLAHITLEKSRKNLLDERFDPRPQIFYLYSDFPEPNKPVDMYTVYLLIEGQRFSVDLPIDGVSGKFLFDRSAASLGGGMPVNGATENFIFADIEERQKRIGEKPGDIRKMPIWIPPGVGKDMACPQTGWWWAPPDPPTPTWAQQEAKQVPPLLPPVCRYFRKGELMPSPFPEDDNEWGAAWMWSEDRASCQKAALRRVANPNLISID
jgi:hypothetical protein